MLNLAIFGSGSGTNGQAITYCPPERLAFAPPTNEQNLNVFDEMKRREAEKKAKEAAAPAQP